MAAMWSPIIALILLQLQLAPSSSSYVQWALGGNVYPVGHFYVQMEIGGKPYFLDIDTGSNLTWLECKHPKYTCKLCKGPHPPYAPNISQNLKAKCGDLFCTALHKDLPQQPRCSIDPRHECHYSVRYADGSTSAGVIANDMLSVNVLAPPSRVQIKFLFGCGCSQQPQKVSPVDGLLGLGMGQVGFVAHLKAKKLISKDIIGHCLSINGGGYLFVGEHDLPAHITWAPMIKHSYYYTPGPAYLVFGKEKISNKMVVFDSGATYTYIPHQAYNELVTKVENSVHSTLKKVTDPAHPVCWKGPFHTINEVKGKFKPLALEFPKQAMHIPPQNYLVLTKLKNVCLGILDGSAHNVGEMMLIGDVTMQDFLVIYDNVDRRIGWVTKQCSTPMMAPTRVL